MFYQHEQREKRERYVGPRPGFPECVPEYWNDMKIYLAERQLNNRTAVENGWFLTFFQGCPRIVIPCSNSLGVPYFQARAMSSKVKLRYASPAASRDDSIVVVWPADRAKGSVVTEGPMDALASADLGYLGIATMGNQPNEEVLEHVASVVRSFQPVLVVPDADALEFGPLVLCALAQRGISGGIVAPHKKDIAEMSVKERKRFLWL